VWLRKPALDVTETDWDQALDINLKGPFFLAQAVGRMMLKQGHGVIINITDGSAFQVWPGYAPHAASKTGLIALTKSFALELAPTVRVNAIAPGAVLMPPNTTPEIERGAMGHTILGRIGTPEDVAKMSEFIIERDYATGAVYLIDGGMPRVNDDHVGLHRRRAHANGSPGARVERGRAHSHQRDPRRSANIARGHRHAPDRVARFARRVERTLAARALRLARRKRNTHRRRARQARSGIAR
jgi:hypothetical protein